MHDFHYVKQQLFCESVALDSLVAKFALPYRVEGVAEGSQRRSDAAGYARGG